MFQLGAKYLSKVVTVAKMTGDEQDIKFASFIIAELNNYILAFLNVIKTSFSHQRQGITSTFIGGLVDFMEELASKGNIMALFRCGLATGVGTHEFFAKKGFRMLFVQ